VRNKPDGSANRLYIFSVIASLLPAGEAISFNEPNEVDPMTQRPNGRKDAMTQQTNQTIMEVIRWM